MNPTFFIKLLSAIAIVESENNPNAIGDYGKSVGLYQISESVIIDVNEYYNKDYTLTDAFSPTIAHQIAVLYLKRWGSRYRKKFRKEPDFEVYARMWNGGPNGWSKKSTLPYWKKIQRALRNEIK